MPIWIHRKAMRGERFVEKSLLIVYAKMQTKINWDIEQMKTLTEKRLGNSVVKTRLQKRHNAQE